MDSVNKQSKLDYSSLNKKVGWSDIYKEIKNTNFQLRTITFAVSIYIAWGLSIAMTRNLSFNSIFFILFITIFIALGVIHSTKKAIRMRYFAADNHLKVLTGEPGSQFSGMIFSLGRSRSLSGYKFPDESDVDIISNYHYTTGSGKSRQTHRYGFIRIQLPRRLPHMVLDARVNNILGRFSNLPSSFKGDQRISLEGDFDKYFTLYAPKEYERDTLYVFTPDIMQLMIEDTANYDVEIIDNYMYLYTDGGINIFDPERMESMMSIASKLANKFDRRVDFYADERINDRDVDLVADPGIRLKSKWSWVNILVFIIILLYVLSRIGIAYISYPGSVD